MSDRQKVVAFDLDGTLLEYSPGMAEKDLFGPPLPGMVSEVKKLKKDDWKIVIWTCREDSPELRSHLDKCGIPYDEINNNHSGMGHSPKIYADVYVDDRGFTFNGRAEGLAEKIKNFEPWHKTPC